MTKADPSAALSGGKTNAPAEEQLPQRDDELRRIAAERLAEHLEIGASLVARCEHLAGLSKGDRTGPLYAAARLMRADAEIARALATMVGVERRSKSIIERVQPVDPKKAELNSTFQKQKLDAEGRLKVYRRMEEIVAQSIRARSGDPQAHDQIADLIKHEEEEIADLDQMEKNQTD